VNQSRTLFAGDRNPAGDLPSGQQPSRPLTNKDRGRSPPALSEPLRNSRNAHGPRQAQQYQGGQDPMRNEKNPQVDQECHAVGPFHAAQETARAARARVQPALPTLAAAHVPQPGRRHGQQRLPLCLPANQIQVVRRASAAPGRSRRAGPTAPGRPASRPSSRPGIRALLEKPGLRASSAEMPVCR